MGDRKHSGNEKVVCTITVSTTQLIELLLLLYATRRIGPPRKNSGVLLQQARHPKSVRLVSYRIALVLLLFRKRLVLGGFLLLDGIRKQVDGRQDDGGPDHELPADVGAKDQERQCRSHAHAHTRRQSLEDVVGVLDAGRHQHAAARLQEDQEPRPP